MGAARSQSRRVFITDARQDGSYLRTTWHPDRRTFVVSTWRDEVCTGSIRLTAAAAGELAHLLIRGLTEAATLAPAPAPDAEPTPVRAPRARLGAWLDRLVGRTARPAGPPPGADAGAGAEGPIPLSRAHRSV